MPEDAIKTPIAKLLRHLEDLLGADLTLALDPSNKMASPVGHLPHSQWLKTARCVGVNVRTIHHFWNIIPYALTLPAAQNVIHILPIWEPGVVASLYGPASWNINPEFFSHELQQVMPHLDTVEKQLKVVINILHLLGKAVGMDVVPHTDRYSEMVLANPQHFEWLQREGTKIKDHSANLHEKVQQMILEFLRYRGSANPQLAFSTRREVFFGPEFSEELRLEIMFGKKYDYHGRLKHRKELVNLFYHSGLETVPATMGPPYRGLEVDPSPDAQTVDEDGRIWHDYRLTQPTYFSRVFGPLARYKLFEPKDNNIHWQLDFSKPRLATYHYVAQHYLNIQQEYGFDFMRGDMSHVQMRPFGVPRNARQDKYYDILGFVKTTIAARQPSFAYFAESFLAPPGQMAYGSEIEHLNASLADTTLGDLQSDVVGNPSFMQKFYQYRAILEHESFAPNFTLMTADKDDPRFDQFYLKGNELRYFVGIFLTDMPSYMGLGFECRDPHPTPAPNEHYTKLYVFQVTTGAKKTLGRYVWGKNRPLYYQIVRIKRIADQIFPNIQQQPTRWLIPPEPDGHRKVLAWMPARSTDFIFLANFDTENDASIIQFELPASIAQRQYEVLFSTARESSGGIFIDAEDNQLLVHNIWAGECIILSSIN